MIGVTEGDFEKEVLECELPVFTCFTAKWCRSCYPACLLTDELAKKYEEKVKFVKVDIEKSLGIAERYHVVVVPTFLLFISSQLASKLLGFQYVKPMQSLLNSVTGENEPTEVAQAKESDGLSSKPEATIRTANSEAEIKIRNMKICDFSACFSIDQQIRASGKVTTYASITAKDVFDNSEDIQHSAFPISYVDFISRDKSAEVELGLLAEVEGEVRGFLLGRIVHAGEAPTEVGEISILGVAPDYQRRGIATELVKAISKRFEDKGIETVRIQIDQSDNELIGFFKRLGFKARHLLDYYKPVKNDGKELIGVS